MSLSRSATRRWCSLLLLATVSLAGVALVLGAWRAPPESALAAIAARDSSWPPRGNLVHDGGLIRKAVATWDRAGTPAGHHDRIQVLLATSDPALGAVVMLEGVRNGRRRLATLTGARGASGEGRLTLRDDRSTLDLASSSAIALLVPTREERVDDSLVAIALARPGATVDSFQSTAFDVYRQRRSTAAFMVSVVPAGASVANTRVEVAAGASIARTPLLAATSAPKPAQIGQGNLRYLPTGFRAAGSRHGQHSTTRLYTGPGGGSLRIVEQRGSRIDQQALLAGIPGDLGPANPHAGRPMLALAGNGQYGFAWTDASGSLGYSVLATGGDAQIAAYHVAQGMQTP